MKENNKTQINAEDVARIKRSCTILAILMIVLILTAVPLYMYRGTITISVNVVVFAVTMYFAFRVEKEKKRLNIQTYEEIRALFKGKSLEDIEKNRK